MRAAAASLSLLCLLGPRCAVGLAQQPGLRATLQAHDDAVLALAFSPDGKTLASAGGLRDRYVVLRDARTGKQTASLRGHQDGVFSLSFSPDGKVLASASRDRTVRIWDGRTGRALATLKGHETPVLAVAFSPDGRVLASSGDDGSLRTWDADAASKSRWSSLTTVKDPASRYFSLAFSPDGQLLAGAGGGRAVPVRRRPLEDGSLELWDRRGKGLATLSAGAAPFYSAAFSPDGKTLAAAGSSTSAVGLWDVGRRRSKGWMAGRPGTVLSLAFSPDGKTVAAGGSTDSVRDWPCCWPSFARYNSHLVLWDVERRQPRSVLSPDVSVVTAVSFSPDGRSLASGGANGTVRLWDLPARWEP